MIDLGPCNTGFRLEFPNGWTVSVQFGEHNYASNARQVSYPFGEPHQATDTAEVAAFSTVTGNWYKFKSLPDSGDDVYPNVTSELIAAAIAEVAALPPYQETSE